LSRGVCPDRNEASPESPEVKTYVSQWDSLVLINGVAYRKFERPEGGVLFYQVITPRPLRVELLELIHASAAGHLAVKKTSQQV